MVVVDHALLTHTALLTHNVVVVEWQAVTEIGIIATPSCSHEVYYWGLLVNAVSCLSRGGSSNFAWRYASLCLHCCGVLLTKGKIQCQESHQLGPNLGMEVATN